MKGDSMLLFLILFPMAGAVLAYLIGRKHKKARDINRYDEIEEYIKNYCAYECRYFILKKKKT